MVGITLRFSAGFAVIFKLKAQRSMLVNWLTGRFESTNKELFV
jgi:hypothetical protein